MTQTRGSLQQKIIIALLVVGLLSGLVILFLTYLAETKTLENSIGQVFQAIAIENAEIHSHSYNLLLKGLILGPTVIAILALFSYLAANWIVKPIKVLSEGASLITQGRLDHSLRIKTGDEIERLADAFNQMAKDLEKRIEEIRLERDKLNTVMDSIGDGLVILDDKECNIQHMNIKFIELYGKESIGKPCREVFGIVDNPCKECSVRKEQNFRPHTLEVTTDKGLTYLITHCRLKNMDGSDSIVEIFKDITERKKLEQQLLSSERLAALSQFSSTFAHDLRNPIIAVKKTIEMLRDSPSLSHDGVIQGVYTDLISTCGLLLGLVNDVLDIHQVSYRDLPLLFSSFSIKQVLEEVIKLLRIEAEERGVQAEISDGDRDIWIEGDRRRLQRVFINLLSNAIRYSPPSGNIKMSFQTSLSVNPQETPNLLFKIEDDGPGIEPSEVSRVFELFYRRDREGIKAGTGLGLYFCKVVVEAHGGKIWVENREKGGAIFYIEIPLIRREADAYQDFNSR